MASRFSMQCFGPVLLILCLYFVPSIWAMEYPLVEISNDPLVGKAAPEAVLVKSDGTSGNVIASRQGKKAILVFWATWCPHCFEELGNINNNFTTIENKGIKVILVDIGEAKEDVGSYFNQRQFKLTSFVDENSFLQETYHLVGVPTIMFIDEKGIIRNVTHEFPSDFENYFSIK